jgi:hypothetical protein
LDISAKKDEGAGLETTEGSGGIGIKDWAGDTGHEKLAE